jgi:hypothetical protein
MHSCLFGAPSRRAARPRYALPLLHSFGRVRDRQAIRGAGASTEPAAGLPCVDLLLAPPVKLVVVAPPLTRKSRSRFADVLPANQSFSEWRDPDSNRGHHDLQSPCLRSYPFYCVHQIGLFAGVFGVWRAKCVHCNGAVPAPLQYGCSTRQLDSTRWWIALIGFV